MQWGPFKFSFWFCCSNHTSMTHFPCITSPLLLSPNTLITFTNNQMQWPTTSTWPPPPFQTTFTSITPLSPQLCPLSSQFSSPTPSLPPLDLIPTNEDTSESGNSDNFSEPEYDNSDNESLLNGHHPHPGLWNWFGIDQRRSRTFNCTIHWFPSMSSGSAQK